MVLGCIQRDSRCLNCFFQNCVVLVLDFDSLFELKLLLEVLDLGNQIEVNFKISWLEKHKRVADLKVGGEILLFLKNR